MDFEPLSSIPKLQYPSSLVWLQCTFYIKSHSAVFLEQEAGVEEPSPPTSEAVPETVPETVPEAFPEAVPEAVPGPVPEPVPEPVIEAVPEPESAAVPEAAPVPAAEAAPAALPTISPLPEEVPYLLVGAGTASFAAFRAIKSRYTGIFQVLYQRNTVHLN